MDKLWAVILGLVLYTLSSIVAATVVAPLFAPFIASYFSVFTIYATIVFGSVISFPVLILFFAAFNYFGLYGEIPEVSS